MNPEAGEIFALSLEERKKLMQVGRAVMPAEVPVFGGVTGTTLDEAIANARDAKEAGMDGKVTLKFDDVCALDTVRHISLELHQGEILGIGGLTDSGMHDVGKVAFGLLQPHKGEVVLVEKNVKIKNPSVAIKNKVGYVSKNRDQEALMLASTIKNNICLTSLDQLKKGFIITKRDEKRLAKKMGQLIGVKMSSINQNCMYLSGGNKQKVVLSKWLGNESEILILDCPTRGIDIGVKQAIYKIIKELKASGRSILMISEELPELIGMCDRIAIMKNGRITSIFKRDDNITEKDLIRSVHTGIYEKTCVTASSGAKRDQPCSSVIAWHGWFHFYALFSLLRTECIFNRFLHIEKYCSAFCVEISCDLITQLWFAGVLHKRSDGLNEILITGTERCGLFALWL